MEIKKYWDEQAIRYGVNDSAVNCDANSSEMEVNEIVKLLKPTDAVVDFGCGNGWKDLIYSNHVSSVTAFDYSKEMIDVATLNWIKSDEFFNNVSFDVRDILEPPMEEMVGSFDVVITNRCLINLQTEEEQLIAFKNCIDMLKPNGKYIMVECTKQGLANINIERSKLHLPQIEERWHNNYLSDSVVFRMGESRPVLYYPNYFNSTYYLISRTINASLGYSYDSEINRLATKLTSRGNFSPLVMYVFTKT